MKPISEAVDDILHAAAERAVNHLRSSMNLSPHTADAIRRVVRAVPLDEQIALNAVITGLIGEVQRAAIVECNLKRVDA